jgi:hypothetical protein
MTEVSAYRAGQPLPELVIDVTPTFVVAGAIATRDFQDVHHDRASAVQRGGKDIFVNILTTTGLVQRYVTDWAGPEALVRKIAIRLGAPCYAGDTLTFSGRIAAGGGPEDTAAGGGPEDTAAGGGPGQLGGRLPVNPHGGQLGEAYIHGMNGIAEAVRQVRGTAVSQVPGDGPVLVTAGTGVPTSGLVLGP